MVEAVGNVLPRLYRWQTWLPTHAGAVLELLLFNAVLIQLVYIGTDCEPYFLTFRTLYYSTYILFPHLFFSVLKFTKYISRFFTRTIWRNANSYIVMSLHTTAVCVMKRFLCYLHWRVISAYTVQSVHIPVMCVISHSVVIWIWKSTNRYTVESVHITVIRVISHWITAGVGKDVN